MLLGQFSPTVQTFAAADSLLSQSFKKLSNRKRFDAVNNALLQCIRDEAEPCFLLPAVIDFITRVNSKKILLEPYRMQNFEFWLNHYSNCTAEENSHIRSKIVGKKLPREEYQCFFPIGMNKTLTGSHFVAAHLSPDVDTTIASFWGWVDAFGARVGSGVHTWALPGQITDSHLKMLFQTLFKGDIFTTIAKETPNLSLTALDLVSKKGSKVIIVDDKGNYKGDLRPSDTVAVNQVTEAFYSLVRWFEHTLYYRLISAYANGYRGNVFKELLETELSESDAAKEFTDLQKSYVDLFVKDVLHLKDETFKELFHTLNIKLPEYTYVEENVFKHLEVLFRAVADASAACRTYLERLDILLAIKEKVLGIGPLFITLKSDVEEIRSKMASHDYLTVAIPEEDDNWFAVGIVSSADVNRKVLGTVSLRDFSSEQETKMAPYLEVVSVIDHHKSDIKTSSASTIIVGDAQSANTLVAEQVLKLNERYSLLGMSQKAIEKEKNSLQARAKTVDELKRLQRLLQLSVNANRQDGYYIHPMREYSEYLFFLLAILDDTDLLTKVSKRDLDVVAKLLNRMKSIATQSEIEILSEDNLDKILQNEDMHSLYKNIYAHKEKEVEENLEKLTTFADTKEQNRCAEVGQTKLFSTNIASFQKHREKLQKEWLRRSKSNFEKKPHIDLYMQMITTIATADEVHQAQAPLWKHQDELWIWIPPTQTATEHLVSFLGAFSASQTAAFTVEVANREADLLFSQNFPQASRILKKDLLPFAILHYKAGLLNSRKALITPYLPRSL